MVLNVMSELFLRVSFSALWIIFFGNVIIVSYSAKGSVSKKKTTRLARRLRFVAIALAVPYFFGTMLYILLPIWITSFSIPFPDWVRLVMVGVAILAELFISWGYLSLGRNWAPSVSGVRKDTVLVTAPPYTIVRHPIYLGVFIFMIALAILAANLFILLPTLALLALLYTSIREEEVTLIDRFGEEYLEYMRRTPRLIPKFSHKDLN